MPKCAVFLIGLPGSGKSTGAAYLEQLGFVPISAGDTIRAICQKQGLALTRENLSTCGQRLLSEHGSAYFAELLLNKANSLEKVVFEGIRPPEVVLWLRQRICKTLTIFVEAAERERLRRLLLARGEDEPSYRKVMAFPMEQDILQIKSLVDETVQNDAGVGKFYDDLRRAVLPLLSACNEQA
ncbi:MAG TPA: AAA family ATPase [Pyrinomonadaceae bacterium]|nr:AAA family ATPase [Pyrinomonadaceae bacterium]